ncbi:hypothetical protein [Cognatitamlana onchidii]|uniref:hypothetical protein n=1 Tax=Cognatitamlana onchidii TaxID=2562860 RepID=UPI001F31CBAA|nr:hypothetical protein [Algibacter onchidii]
MIRKMFFAVLALGFLAYSCSDDDDIVVLIPEAGTITGGPFTFIVDGTADFVTGISTDPDAVGTNRSFIVTDNQGKILGLPPTNQALEGVNFDEAGVGICLIWYIRYENGLNGLAVGENANNLEGSFDLSNSITVNRLGAPDAGVLSGGPFTFIVDGTPDFVSGISTDPNAVGTNRSFIVTDDQGKILGLPPTIEALQGVNFDGAGIGKCLIWYIRYEDVLVGLAEGENANNLQGSFNLSNAITVNRIGKPNAGKLSGGPFKFVVDGTPDMISGVSTDSNAVGSNSTFVITDIDLNILGTPKTLEMLEGVNFDNAGRGVCLIWYLRYEDDTNLETVTNAEDLTGTFSLSNAIRVERGPNADVLTGGPFNFKVDGTPDMVSGIGFENANNRVGTNATWVITDEDLKILGTPKTLADVENVNFDGAGVGVCFIWYLRYENDTNIATVTNAADLTGTFHLSNSIKVTRN